MVRSEHKKFPPIGPDEYTMFTVNMPPTRRNVVQTLLAAPMCFFIALAAGCWAWPLAAQSDFFEKSVQPVLRENCQTCHSQQARTSGLALDSRAAALTGGNRGAAVKPGAAGESLLIQAI